MPKIPAMCKLLSVKKKKGVKLIGDIKKRIKTLLPEL